MANIFLMKQIQNKLQNEIDEINGYIQREIETGTQDTLYRECKLFVFGKAVLNHIENFIINKEEKGEDIENITDLFLKRKHIIEEIYSCLYEKNGTKYDLFMNKNEIIGGIEFFINNG